MVPKYRESKSELERYVVHGIVHFGPRNGPKSCVKNDAKFDNFCLIPNKLISTISFSNLCILINFHTNCEFFGLVFAQKGSLVAVPLGEMKFGKLRKSELEINHFFRQFGYFDEFCCNLG